MARNDCKHQWVNRRGNRIECTLCHQIKQKETKVVNVLNPISPNGRADSFKNATNHYVYTVDDVEVEPRVWHWYRGLIAGDQVHGPWKQIGDRYECELCDEIGDIGYQQCITGEYEGKLILLRYYRTGPWAKEGGDR